MHIALCTLDAREYEALDFAQLPAAQREEKRQHLRCTGCPEKARYRRRASNGREPCFYAEHQEGCLLASTGGIVQGVNGQQVPPRANGARRIVLNLRGPAAVGGPEGGPGNAGRRQGGGRRFNADGRVEGERTYRTLRGILRDLVGVPDFQHSDLVIDVPDEGASTVRAFFVAFDRVEERHLGQFHGFWGRIQYVRFRGETYWLNTGDAGFPSLVVDAEIMPDLLQAQRVPAFDGLAERYLLWLGRLAIGPTGKKWGRVDNLTHLTLLAR